MKQFHAILLTMGVLASAPDTRLVAAEGTILPTWTFDGPDLDGWEATRHVAPLQTAAGALRIVTTDGDPGIMLQDPGFTPQGNEWVDVRLRASRIGNAQLFWFQGDTDDVGMATFHVPRANEWVDLAVFPTWKSNLLLRTLRLDVYHFGEGCSFEVERIAIRPWPRTGSTALAGPGPWRFTGPDANAQWEDWRASRDTDVFMSPPLAHEEALSEGWISIRVQAARDAVLAFLWTNDRGSSQRLAFPVYGDGVDRTVNLHVAGDPAWTGKCSRIGLEIPQIVQKGMAINALAFAPGPVGPPETALSYLGFEEGQNRAGRTCRILAVIENRGGTAAPATSYELVLPAGVHAVASLPLQAAARRLEPKDRARLRWDVEADTAGPWTIALRQTGSAPDSVLGKAELTFLTRRNVAAVPYVPAPKPVRGSTDVFMFYFPGWDSPGKWAPIRGTTPERRPLLGWYDEANPECVDWQIKWATENSITGFIVDWYWNQGTPQLEHWLQAYQKARYRDELKLFILWCDHGGRDIGTIDDMRPLAQYWVKNLFSLPGYYRIDDKPVVALFEPHVLRASLGGSQGARDALALAQSVARDAGYKGITFLSANNNYPIGSAAVLAEEGYYGATTYHEPGTDYHDCPSQQMRSYAHEVETAPEKWRSSLSADPRMRYFPLVDSGWDSRPWHGYRGSIVHGRTVPLFEQWLQHGKAFCEANQIPMIVLGPANEWGEGSYLEPCTEFGFGMFEAVRRVFGTGSPEAWPVNLSPSDVGLGPYSFDMTSARHAWSFDDGLEGWSPGLGCTTEVIGGVLHLESINDDPVLTCATDLIAADVSTFAIRLRCWKGTPKQNYAQLFWGSPGTGISGAAVVGFVFDDSEEFREYTVDLSAHPRWRGQISQLRFDPCCEKGLIMEIDSIRLQ